MIKLTKPDGREIVVNADEIETIETSYDSTLTLKSGRKIIVKESADVVINDVVRYKRECFSSLIDSHSIHIIPESNKNSSSMLGDDK